MYQPCFAGAEAAIWLIGCFCHADGVPAGRQDKRQLVCTLATRPWSTAGASPTVNGHQTLAVYMPTCLNTCFEPTHDP